MTYDRFSGFDVAISEISGTTLRPQPIARWSPRYRVFKFVFDKGMAVAALPVILSFSIMLLVLNPYFNPGPLFFRQDRMGMGGKRFRMWKFRTMLPAVEDVRHHSAPVEEHRITPLGRIMRKTRVDELPNFFNVLRGEMSVIGPRPDAWSHAQEHAKTVPYYQTRFRVRPGITGLAQVRGGYADCANSLRRKARYDQFYVSKSRIKMELEIIWRTIKVMATGFGAK